MRVQLLKEMPELGRRLPPDQLAEATRSLQVAIAEVPAGPWDAPNDLRPVQLGYLVTRGTVLREVCIGPDWSSEMLGPGDLLQPWLEDASSFVEARWLALEPLSLAVIDRASATDIGRFPDLLSELVERLLSRSRALAVHAVIEGIHRIDERLLVLFWYLAEQRGMRVNGHVTIPLRLTHAHLARLVGARRPTVTTALGTLDERGQVRRASDGTWIVSGEPPRAGV